MVSLLLSKGADPNEIIRIYDERSVWDIFLLSCYENADQAPPKLKDTWYKAVELLIEYRRTRKFDVRRRPTEDSRQLQDIRETLLSKITPSFSQFPKYCRGYLHWTKRLD